MLNALALLLPPWALGLVGVLILALLVPGFRFRVRNRQVREAVRRMVRAEPGERDRLVARALDRAGDSVALLAVLATEARKRQMPDLYDAALARLDDHPKGGREAARIRRETRARTSDPMHPLELVLRVEAMLEAGAVEAARLRLDEGLARHPDHPELVALRERLS